MPQYSTVSRGPFDLNLSEDVAQVIIAWWYRKVIERLAPEGMELLYQHRRYLVYSTIAVPNFQGSV